MNAVEIKENPAPLETQIETKVASKSGGKGSSQILSNVLMNWVAFMVTLLTGFFMSPFLVRQLGESVYGVWLLIGSLTGYLGLLDLGITPSIVKYIAEHRERGDQEAINRVVTAGIAIFSLIGLVSLVASGVVALYFNDIFHLAPAVLAPGTAAIVVLLTGLNLALAFPASVFVGVVYGYQRYDVNATINTIGIPVRCGLIVWTLSHGYGLVTLAVLTLIFDLSRLIYLTRWALRLNPALHISRSHLNRATVRQLVNYSASIFLIKIAYQINFTADSIVIGIYLSAAAVTAYFVAARLTLYLRQLVGEMVGVLTPTISGLDARRDNQGIRDLLSLSTKYTLLLALPPGAVFLVLGDVFIALWMGPHFQSSALFLRILTIAILVHLFEMPIQVVLRGLGKHHIVARLTLLQAATNLLLTLILARTPLQLTGVALATAISMLGFAVFAIPLYLRRYLEIPIGEHLRRAALPALAVQIPFVGLLLLMRATLPSPSLLIFFVQLAVLLIPYGVLVYLFCMTAAERLTFLRFARKLGLKSARAS